MNIYYNTRNYSKFSCSGNFKKNVRNYFFIYKGLKKAQILLGNF